MAGTASNFVTCMASRLVETVMINVDDFSDSFLTCGTCFSGYDRREQAAKLLPCSHTICLSCLNRILETQVPSTSFRCPICREPIAVPTGGASSFPPAFIVNQLLDLLATQRRDVVPKCRSHPNQELLFCETCDVVFCSDCRGRNHEAPTCISSHDNGPHCSQRTDEPSLTTSSSTTSALNHNVISFNVAIKRCTEIMLYKMHLCVQELNNAQDAVSSELDRLWANKTMCIEAIDSKFSEVMALVERRRTELLDTVRRLTDEKQCSLVDQLSLIESEREAVHRECNSLKGILDVRSISKAINYLNDKLDTVTSLMEPRENAFLRYQDCPSQSGPRRGLHNTSSSVERSARNISCPFSEHSGTSSGATLIDLARCLAAFGRILVSTTYPALCTATLPSQLVIHWTVKAVIRAVDYHGRPQSAGGTDPIEAALTDPEGRPVPIDLSDVGDGTYEVLLRPITHGTHRLSIQILNRHIRGSPFQLHVRRAQSRLWSFNEGADNRALIQPFAVAYGPFPKVEPDCGEDTRDFIYLLDTGNSRLLVLDPHTGSQHSTLIGGAFVGQAATGIAWSPDGLWIVNWRSKYLYLLNPRTDQVVRSLHSSHFVEPTGACRCPATGKLYIADNGAGCVFVCDPLSGHVRPFVGAGYHGLTTDSSDTALPKSSNCLGPLYASPMQPIPASSLESKSFRRITGLCVTPNGELVISSGSTIRIFSSDGLHLNSLVPPIVQNDVQNCSTARSASFAARAAGTQKYSGRTAVDSSHTLDIACSARNSLNLATLSCDRYSLPQPAIPLRGQFGGVCVSEPIGCSEDSPPDLLGFCLLASYSDRTRSGVVVWPQRAWANQSNPVDTLSSDGDIPSLSAYDHGLVSGHRSARSFDLSSAPYLVEAEPGLRRLAGLAALRGCRHLVAVDQGAQSLCCLRYA